MSYLSRLAKGLLWLLVLVSKAYAAGTEGMEGDRVALVIGNSNYGGGENDVSGARDADVMAEALAKLRFKPILKVTNADFGTMTDSLDKLAKAITNASVVVFFYSGHGFHANDDNFLVPSGTSIDLGNAISLTEVRNSLGHAPLPARKLVFLDACRETELIEKSMTGFNDSIPPLDNTLFAYSTSFNQAAAAGNRKGFSPFTSSLVRNIREPGLHLANLLERVANELKFSGQTPQFHLNEGMADFMFEPPVFLGIEVPEGVKNLFVILNGDIVLDSSQESKKAVQLRADRKNDLVLMVSHGRTFNKNHDWDVPLGWSYKASFISPKGDRWDFGDHEDHPFENGPHHGGVFTVAKATILVDPQSGEVSLPIVTRDDKVWEHDTPVWAQRQTRLYERSVKNLPLDKILDPQGLPNFGAIPAATVALLLREFLTSGKFLNHQIAEPERTFFEVWGNEAYGDLVQTCVVEKEDDRVKDLQASVAAALRRDPQPFAVFDRELNLCVQDLAERKGLSRADVQVWTAIDDRSHEPEGSPVAGGPATATRNGSTRGGPSHE